MMNWKRIVLVASAAMLTLGYTACQKDKKEPEKKDGKTLVITFDDAPAAVVASDEYGSNLNSAAAAGQQVTTGYFAKVTDATYVQFPINYTANWDASKPWSYEFSNGGVAVSKFTNMTQAGYKNQCSVYNKDGAKSGSNFAVCFGDAKIYVTDKMGYTVTTPNKQVTGKAKKGKFNSVWVCNTTYAYLVMKDGNKLSKALPSSKGWFKVIFKALDDKGNPIAGKEVSYYLANFDESKNAEAKLEGKIREGWNEVDLSPLGDNVSAITMEYDGSDKGQYGLNTPKYVAIDDLSVTVAE